MDLNTFKEVVKLITNEHEKSRKLYELGIDLIEYAEDYNKLVEILLKEVFDEFRVDLIYWWLYENTEKVITFNNTQHDVTSIEDFHNFITNIS